MLISQCEISGNMHYHLAKIQNSRFIKSSEKADGQNNRLAIDIAVVSPCAS